MALSNTTKALKVCKGVDPMVEEVYNLFVVIVTARR